LSLEITAWPRAASVGERMKAMTATIHRLVPGNIGIAINSLKLLWQSLRPGLRPFLAVAALVTTRAVSPLITV